MEFLKNSFGKNATGKKYHFSLINRLLNINRREWPRVWNLWLISFFYRFGFVIGWTTLTGMFISRFGIHKLPMLFIANGTFIILGTLFYSEIVEKVKREWLMIVTTITAGMFLFLATFFVERNNLLFFTLLLFAESVLLTQLNIIISLFKEELFSPLESERTFPIIESSETVGSIVGGFVIAFGTAWIPVYKFIFIWIIALVLIIPVILKANGEIPNLPSLTNKKRGEEIGHINVFKRIQTSLFHIQAIPFLKALFVVVLIQWVFVNVLEFQYMKAVQQVVSHTEEEKLTFHEYGRIFHISLLTDPKGISRGGPQQDAIALYNAKHPSETALIQKLGSLYVLFGFLALGMQLFFAGRLIHSIGVIGALVLYPLIMLLSLAGLLLKFGILSAIVTKANFEIGNVIHKNAYHTSYYVLKQNIRENAREFLEGFIRPLGGIIGMILILVVQMAFAGKMLTMWVNVMLFTLMTAMFVVVMTLQKKYTKLSKITLLHSGDDIEKWDAIEILGQKGHARGTQILLRSLENMQNEYLLRAKILKTLGERRDIHALPAIVDAFDDLEPDVRFEAVASLRNFGNLGDRFYMQAFSRHRVITELKSLFWRETVPEIRAEIIHVFAKLKEPNAVAFLLEVLEKSEPELQMQCIEACSYFNDPTVASYLHGYLDSPSPLIQIQTMLVLWKFPHCRRTIQSHATALLDANDPEVLKALFCFAGKVNMRKLMPIIAGYMTDDRVTVRFYAALALIQMGNDHAYEIVLNSIGDCTIEMLQHLKRTLSSMNIKMTKRIKKIIFHHIAERIHEIYLSEGGSTVDDISLSALRELQRLYDLLDHKREVYEIRKIMAARAGSCTQLKPALAVSAAV